MERREKRDFVGILKTKDGRRIEDKRVKFQGTVEDGIRAGHKWVVVSSTSAVAADRQLSYIAHATDTLVSKYCTPR